MRKKQYKIFDKLGAYATAKILYDAYELKLYYNEADKYYYVFSGASTIKADTLSDLMFLVDKLLQK